MLLLCGVCEGYVGPGAGFGLATSFLAVLNAILVSLASLLLWPFIALRRGILRSKLPRKPLAGRVVVLGLDGFSPVVAGELMAEGRMPNLSALSKDGSFSSLATTCPGISPVAWTTFQTGVNPGKHAIFDFLAPDRRRYVPTLSSVETSRTSKGKVITRSLRRSRPFWQELGRFGIRSAIVRVPITYPPEKLDGYLLSGMCVPDLRGTQGTYTLLGAEPPDPSGGVHRPLESRGRNRWEGVLEGPPEAGTMCTLGIALECRRGRWLLRMGAGRAFRMHPGRVSDWIGVRFRIRGERGGSARGIVKVCLVDEEGPLLYISAIHPDPWSPPFPVSSPVLYSRYLSGLSGPFATLGLSEDTWACINGAIGIDQFLSTAWTIFEERRRMFRDSLSRIRRGLVVCVFDTSDRIQHMAWSDGRGRGTAVGDMYERMDDLIGETVSSLSRNDLLLVMSDHGFAPFDWCVDFNRFLYEQGYLVMKQGFSPPSADLSCIDWGRTRAYSMGLAGILLNLKGREAQGSVSPGDEAEETLASIEADLMALVGPDGTKPIRSVYRSTEVYKGPYTGRAPDLVVGTGPGYRASWNCVTGGTGLSVLERNRYRWSGDHCHDHVLVPGVLASNRRLSSPASISDIAPTVLRALGLDPPAHMEGRSLLEEP